MQSTHQRCSKFSTIRRSMMFSSGPLDQNGMEMEEVGKGIDTGMHRHEKDKEH